MRTTPSPEKGHWCSLPPLAMINHQTEGEFFIDNLMVRIHSIIEMIWWTGLAPWDPEFPFPGSLISNFLGYQAWRSVPHTWNSPGQTLQPLSSECGTLETIKARFWPWHSGKGPWNLPRCFLFARKQLPSSPDWSSYLPWLIPYCWSLQGYLALKKLPSLLGSP